jgi:hypothetical protein
MEPPGGFEPEYLRFMAELASQRRLERRRRRAARHQKFLVMRAALADWLRSYYNNPG